MPSIRRSIHTMQDVQSALSDIFSVLEDQGTNPVNFNKRILTGIPDPVKDLDAVNFETLKSYVATQIDILAKQLPPKQNIQPADASSVSFNKSIVPKTTATFSIGSATLNWLKGWFSTLNIDSLTASKPVRTDASKNIVNGNLLSTEITGAIPRANGGLANAVVTVYAGTFTGTISGTASLVTGVVTGTCTGTTSTSI